MIRFVCLLSVFVCFLSGVFAGEPVFGKAVWIASSDAEATPRFVRRFTLGEGLSSASLAVTGVGFYEAALNGARVSDRLLDPSQTDYTKRVYYAVYPVSPKAGENELSLMVGHGWYDQRAQGWSFQNAPWRGKPRAIAVLTLKYADGRTETVATDGSWRETVSGIRYDDIREGEWQDGTMVVFDRPVEVVEGPKGALVEADFPGAKKQEAFVPKSVEHLADDAWLVDFGVQMSGWARFAPKDPAAIKGRQLHFRYDERKPPQPRHIDQFASNLGKKGFPVDGEAFQTDHRVFAGTTGEAYEPHFVYHGFRYLTIQGLGRAPTADELTAWQVNTDMKTVGSFECSDPVFNELMKMVDRSYRSNFTDGVPTDCPHREKNGWMGDASLASRYAQYQYENTACYRKWLRDILDAQRSDGALAGIAPTSGWGYDFKPWDTRGPGPAWDSALPVIAWRLHLYRGDDTLLPQVLPALEKNLDYTWSRRRPNDLIDESLGEWCSAGDRPDGRYVLTAYFIGNCQLGMDMAAYLKDARRAAKFRELAARARRALRQAFYRGKGSFEDESQTAQALALAFRLYDSEEEKLAAQDLLVKEIAETDGHVDVGILGLDKMGEVLRDIGENRLFYRMLVNPTEPSPRASWLDKGLTTLAEDFVLKSSWDHIMFGTFGAWAYSDLAGLAPCTDGSADYVICPDPIRELTFVKAKTDFGKGELASEWTRDGEAFLLSVRVPEGTTAKVSLPDGKTSVVGAGEHVFASVLPAEKPLGKHVLTHRHDPMFWVDTSGKTPLLPYAATPGDAHKVRTAWNVILRRTMLLDADEATYRSFYSAVYRLYGRIRNVADASGNFVGADGFTHKAARRRHMRIDLPEAAAADVYQLWSFTANPCDSDDLLWSPVEAARYGDSLRCLAGVADGYFKAHRGCKYEEMWPVIVEKVTKDGADAASLMAAIRLGEALGMTEDVKGLKSLKASKVFEDLDADVRADIETVWETLGLRPQTPCSDLFRVTEPKMRAARLRLFEKDGSENILFIRKVSGRSGRVTFNGCEQKDGLVRRSDLFKGGELLVETAASGMVKETIDGYGVGPAISTRTTSSGASSLHRWHPTPTLRQCQKIGIIQSDDL